MYSHVILGGTFDHMHLGHKLLLNMACLIAKKIVIGVTSTNMLSKKQHVELLESYADRSASVANVVQLMNPALVGDNIYIEPLHDAIGPAGTVVCDADAPAALVISAETRAGGPMVNAYRKQHGLEALDVVEVSLAKPHVDADDLHKLSSTAIRDLYAHASSLQLEWLKQQWSQLCQVSRD